MIPRHLIIGVAVMLVLTLGMSLYVWRMRGQVQQTETPAAYTHPVAAPVLKKAGANSGYSMEFSGTSAIRFFVNVSGLGWSVTGDVPIAMNQWSHVAGVYDGTNICFYLNGALVGTSAVLAASRFGTAAPTFGNGFELDVIAAVILGGVAFTGGEGSITGVVLAVILLGVINSGLISTGIDPHYAQVVKGAALVMAVTLDQLTQEQQERHRKKLAFQKRSPAA